MSAFSEYHQTAVPDLALSHDPTPLRTQTNSQVKREDRLDLETVANMINCPDFDRKQLSGALELVGCPA